MDDQRHADTTDIGRPSSANRFASIALTIVRGVLGCIFGGIVGYILRFPALFMLWGGDWTPGGAQLAQVVWYLFPIGGAIIGVAVGIKPRLLNFLKLYPDR